MKKWSVLLATFLLSSAISVSAYAADKTITVMIDEQPVTFSNSVPIQENGSVSVPFRILFEQLGLQVSWDANTKTITGTKTGLEIQMKIGSKQATVNGQVKTLAVAPKTINNVTYVPLRFISEVTGNNVQWEPKTQSVLITTLDQDTTDAEAEVQAFFDQYVKYSNEENLEGLMGIIHPSSPLAAVQDAFKEQFETFDIAVSIDEISILSSEANEIIVEIVESSDKTEGPYMLDSTSNLIYSLVKGEGDTSWKLYNVQISNIQYHLPEGALTSDVQVPQVENDQILAVLNDNLKYSNEENLDGIMNTIGGSEELLQQTEETYKQIFAMYDLNITLDSTKIIHYADGEAAVYTKQTMKKEAGPEFMDNVSEVVHILQKDQDGKWKFVESLTISIEPLDS